jgi:hypothetical protein
MHDLMSVIQVVPWFGIAAFLLWVWQRHRKASRLESRNRTLEVLKDVTEEEKRFDDSNLLDLVDEFNKRRDSSKKG